MRATKRYLAWLPLPLHNWIVQLHYSISISLDKDNLRRFLFVSVSLSKWARKGWASPLLPPTQYKYIEPCKSIARLQTPCYWARISTGLPPRLITISIHLSSLSFPQTVTRATFTEHFHPEDIRCIFAMKHGTILSISSLEKAGSFDMLRMGLRNSKVIPLVCSRSECSVNTSV